MKKLVHPFLEPQILEDSHADNVIAWQEKHGKTGWKIEEIETPKAAENEINDGTGKGKIGGTGKRQGDKPGVHPSRKG